MYSYRRTFFELVLIAASCLAPLDHKPLYGIELIETFERIELNWTRLKIRFYGENNLSDKAEDGDYGLVRKAALQEGLLYIVDAIGKFRETKAEFNGPKGAQLSHQAGHNVASSTYSLQETYFSTGSVRIHLESSLAKALDPLDITFKHRDRAADPLYRSPKNSALVLNLRSPTFKPSVRFKVIDEAKTTLYSATDVFAETYKKSLMAVWLRQPSESEIKKYAGQNPLYIDVNSNNGNIIVKSQIWRDALRENRALLKDAKVVIALY